MNELRGQNRVRHIGVSNFSISQLQEAQEVSETPVITNQVAYEDQSDLLESCVDNDLLLTAHSPLNVGRGLDNDTLCRIGERYGKTPAQVTLRWLIQQEKVAAIPKAATRTHQEENIDISDFELTTEETNAVFECQGGLLTQLRTRLGL